MVRSYHFLLLLFVYNIFSQDCETANDCFNAEGKPYCVNNVCSQCNPNSLVPECECPPGEYCVSDPEDSSIGSCRSYEKEILGRQCQMSLQNEGASVRKGENDLLFCGLIKFKDDDSARFIEWEGVCIRNVCRQCSQAPFNQVPYAICSDGRICQTDFTMGIAPAGLLSAQFLPHNPVILFYFLQCFIIGLSAIIFIVIVISVSIWCKCKKKKPTEWYAEK